MTATDISNAAQIATIFSVVTAVWAIYANSRENHKQSQLSTFISYAQRYEQIMSVFPEYRSRFDLTILPPENEEVRLAALKYFNLISEEYYLWKNKYIDVAVWKIWEEEIVRTIKSPLMIREWSKVQHEFKSYPEFLRFVERHQGNAYSLSM